MQLYQWVGQALREAISERFQIDETRLSTAIDTVTRPPLAEPKGIENAAAVVDREEMERRLIAKLQSSGQLRAGFLIRAVREKRLSLFEHAVTALGGFTLDQVRAAMVRPGPDALFLMCAAVGIDRAVFPALLEEIRAMNHGRPGVSHSGYPGHTSVAPAAAAREFRTLMGQAGG
jgi:uncharacterized protein (DUF2336 family)